MAQIIGGVGSRLVAAGLAVLSPLESAAQDSVYPNTAGNAIFYHGPKASSEIRNQQSFLGVVGTSFKHSLHLGPDGRLEYYPVADRGIRLGEGNDIVVRTPWDAENQYYEKFEVQYQDRRSGAWISVGIFDQSDYGKDIPIDLGDKGCASSVRLIDKEGPEAQPIRTGEEGLDVIRLDFKEHCEKNPFTASIEMHLTNWDT